MAVALVRLVPFGSGGSFVFGDTIELDAFAY